MDFSIVCAWKDLGDPYRRVSHDWTRRYWRTVFPDAELVEGSPRPFTRARGLNWAVERARHNLILQADPDTIVPVEQAVEAIRLAGEAAGLVVPYDQFLYLRREATAQLQTWPRWEETGGGWAPLAQAFGPGDCDDFGEGGAGPVTAYSKWTWQMAGGYDERFGLWGGDDSAFAIACGNLVAPWRRIAGPALHSWHPRLPMSIPGNREYARQQAILNEYLDADKQGPDAVRALVKSR